MAVRKRQHAEDDISRRAATQFWVSCQLAGVFGVAAGPSGMTADHVRPLLESERE